jgi:hypothetical protein
MRCRTSNEHILLPTALAPHFDSLTVVERDPIKACRIRHPIECNECAASIQCVPNRFYTQIFHQKMRSNVPQTIFISIELHTKQLRSDRGILRDFLNHREDGFIEFEQFLTQRVLDLDFATLDQANNQANVLMRVVGRDSRVRMDQTQFVPAF